MSTKSISNYTTTIAAKKTVGQISTLLAEAKAEAILTEFNNGVAVAVSFRIKTEFGVLTFRLPANVDGVFAVIQRSRAIPAKLRTRDQAARVAWRIIFHWLDAQLALIEAGLVKLEQVFLPYAQDDTGTTVYEKLRDREFGEYLKLK